MCLKQIAVDTRVDAAAVVGNSYVDLVTPAFYPQAQGSSAFWKSVIRIDDEVREHLQNFACKDRRVRGPVGLHPNIYILLSSAMGMYLEQVELSGFGLLSVET